MNTLLDIEPIQKMVFEPRVTDDSFFAVFVFLGGAIIVALSRFIQRDVFIILSKGLFLLKSKEDLAKDGEILSPVTSFLLILQFFGIFSYLLYAKFDLSLKEPLFHLALPAYFLYILLTSWLLTRIFRNEDLNREIQHITFILIQGIGLVYLLLIFIDYYQPILPEARSILLFIPIIVLFAFRILRSTVLAWRENMPWYYIILYFWTLEILPVLVVVKLLFPDWFREWIV